MQVSQASPGLGVGALSESLHSDAAHSVAQRAGAQMQVLSASPDAVLPAAWFLVQHESHASAD
jgi:hypothetical protein